MGVPGFPLTAVLLPDLSPAWLVRPKTRFAMPITKRRREYETKTSIHKVSHKADL